MNIKESLFEMAKKSREHAYAPYSQFKVGAAIYSQDGKIFSGCNVENSSYPCGTCAEAGAISAMICGGSLKISEILIVADTECIVPCGNCLQKIREFGSKDTIIYSANLEGIHSSFKLSDLLPTYFSAKDMENAR